MHSDYKQQVIDFFESRTSYDLEGNSHPNEARRLLEYVEVKPEQKILDLATGTGLVAIPAAKAAAKGSVIGVDISKGMLAQAKDKITAEAIDNLELIEADVETIDFESEQFDLIFCCSALVYVSDISATMDKCYRWLKPNGRCQSKTLPGFIRYRFTPYYQTFMDFRKMPRYVEEVWVSKY